MLDLEAVPLDAIDDLARLCDAAIPGFGRCVRRMREVLAEKLARRPKSIADRLAQGFPPATAIAAFKAEETSQADAIRVSADLVKLALWAARKERRRRKGWARHS